LDVIELSSKFNTAVVLIYFLNLKLSLMLGSKTLEVAIGIIFVFILVSIICSAIRESIEARLKTRAAYLEHGIRQLLQDNNGSGLVKSFYEHPLIYSLFSGTYIPGSNAAEPAILADGRKLPSYIPSRNFALALMDIAARGPGTDEVSSDPQSPMISLDTVRMNVMNLNSPFVQRALLIAIDSAQGDLNKAQKNIEAWYDSSMDRVSGWYKRSTYWVLFWIGLITAGALNINTITIADFLYRNEDARKALVAKAEAGVKDSSVLHLNYYEARAALDSLHLPIGWTAGWGSPRTPANSAYVPGVWNGFFAPILGLLITALAATMGAPFWFDLLNKVMVIRSTVKPHEKSQEEASEDRQLPNPSVVAPAPNRLAQNVPSMQPEPPVAQAGPSTSVPNLRDSDSEIDGCDVEINDITTDEQLPAAEGGVA
jgi:hypothetical protein